MSFSNEKFDNFTSTSRLRNQSEPKPSNQQTGRKRSVNTKPTKGIVQNFWNNVRDHSRYEVLRFKAHCWIKNPTQKKMTVVSLCRLSFLGNKRIFSSKIEYLINNRSGRGHSGFPVLPLEYMFKWKIRLTNLKQIIMVLSQKQMIIMSVHELAIFSQIRCSK